MSRTRGFSGSATMLRVSTNGRFQNQNLENNPKTLNMDLIYCRQGSPDTLEQNGFVGRGAHDSRGFQQVLWIGDDQGVLQRNTPICHLIDKHVPIEAQHNVRCFGQKGQDYKCKFQLFCVLAPQWWNELPADVRMAESLTSFRKRLKTHLFRVHLDSAYPPHPPPSLC